MNLGVMTKLRFDYFTISGQIVEIGGTDCTGTYKMSGGIEGSKFEAFQVYLNLPDTQFIYKGYFDQSKKKIFGFWRSVYSDEINTFEFAEIRNEDCEAYFIIHD